MFQRYDLVKNFPNGDRYIGEATECNVKDGKGTFTWGADKSSYTGEWRKDVMHGRGTLTRRGDGTSDGFVYEGTWVQGQRSGKGECRFTSGRTYSGDWRADHMDGMGILRGADNDLFAVYEGPFVASRMHGNGGTCTYRNGDRYEGSWSRGLRNGLGVLSFGPANPTVIQYRGSFVDDRPGGAHGVILYRDGSTYEGAHDALVRHGHGTWRKASGETYVGEFHHNVRHGAGKLTGAPVSMLPAEARGGGGGATEVELSGGKTDGSADGCAWSYEGQWCDDTMHGIGTMTVAVPDTSRTSLLLFYRGSWSRNTMEGSGSDNVMRWARRDYVGPVRGNVPHGPRGEEKGGILQLRLPSLAPLSITVSAGAPVVSKSPFVHPHHVDAAATDGALLSFDVLSYVGAFAYGRRDGNGRATIRLQSRHSCTTAVDTDPSKPLLRTWYGSVLDVSQVDGEWKDGAPQGRVSWSWPSQRASYDGPVFQGLPDTRQDGSADISVAKGVFTWSPSGGGNVARYSGEFRSGMRHGNGRQQYANDDVYDGAWLHDSREGYGRFCVSRTGDTYSGNWSNDLFHGHGTHARYGVSTYDGEFRAGLRHGTGTLSSTIPPLRYVGSFENDEFEGNGCLQLFAPSSGASSVSGELTDSGVEGVKYEGSFHKGKCHGSLCTATFPSGLIYRGAFVDGATRGFGTLTMVNGDTYEGEVVDGCVKHGKGTMRFADGGGMLTATWVNNRLHGTGVHISRNGVRSEKTYVDGSAACNTSASSNGQPSAVVESEENTARPGERTQSDAPKPRDDSAPNPTSLAGAATTGLPRAPSHRLHVNANTTPLPLSLKGFRPAAGATTTTTTTTTTVPYLPAATVPSNGQSDVIKHSAAALLEQTRQRACDDDTVPGAHASPVSVLPAACSDSSEHALVRAMTTNIMQLTEAICALDASCDSVDTADSGKREPRDECIRKMQRSSLQLARLRETQRLLAAVQGAATSSFTAQSSAPQ